MEIVEASEEKKGSLSAAQRRAELRRRKLLMNSEDRMNRIVGNVKNESDINGTGSVISAPPPRAVILIGGPVPIKAC